LKTKSVPVGSISSGSNDISILEIEMLPTTERRKDVEVEIGFGVACLKK
jgi:hypothetical protein